MKSSIQTTVPMFELVGGTSRALPAHLPLKGKWFKSNNMRFSRGTVTERPRQLILDNLNAFGDTSPAFCIEAKLFYPLTGNTTTYCWTGRGLYGYLVLGGFFKMSRMVITQSGGAATNPFNYGLLSGTPVTTAPQTWSIRIKTASPGATYEYTTNGGAFTGAVLWSAPTSIATAGGHVYNFPGFTEDVGLAVGMRWDFTADASAAVNNNWLWCDTYVHGSGIYFVTNDGVWWHNGGYYIRIDDGFFTGARFLQIFYEHLIVLAPGGSVPRIAWSDLYHFGVFQPETFNEADFYDLEQTNDVNVLTGQRPTDIKKLRDICVSYLQDSIYLTRYVGLPTVMQTTQFAQNVGSFFRHGVASFNNTHYFWSKDNCWSFDGVTLTPIGEDAREQFFQEALPATEGGYDAFHASFNSPKMEARFYYYYSQGNGAGPGDTTKRTCNRCAVFSVLSGDWYFEDAYSSAELFPPQDFNELILVSRTDGPRIDLCNPDLNFNPGSSDPTTEGTFFLETRDLIYQDQADLQSEIEAMLLDAANWKTGGNVTPLPVFVSTRQFVKDVVQWEYVGVYTGTESAKLLSFPKINGRIFRIRIGATPAPMAPINSRTQDLTPVAISGHTNTILYGSAMKPVATEAEL